MLMSCFSGRASLLVGERLENERWIGRRSWIAGFCWGRFLGIAMNLLVAGVI